MMLSNADRSAMRRRMATLLGIALFVLPRSAGEVFTATARIEVTRPRRDDLQ